MVYISVKKLPENSCSPLSDRFTLPVGESNSLPKNLPPHNHLLEAIANTVDSTDKLRHAGILLNTPPQLGDVLVKAS